MHSPNYIDTVSLFLQSEGIEGKRVTDWVKAKRNKEFLEALSQKLGVPVRGKYGSGALLEFEPSGKNRLYMHPAVAERYAVYLTSTKKIPLSVYVIHMHGTNFYKIGIASDVPKRLTSLQCANPVELSVVKKLRPRDAPKLEADLHAKFKEKRVRGEWFELNDDDLQNIKCR